VFLVGAVEDHRNKSAVDLIVVENVLDDFGFPFYAAALAEVFQPKKAIAIKRGADNQDIIGIENLPGAPKRPALRR
jgi:hypothetical protein